MKFMELEPYGFSFKNVIAGPAPVGRILNYIRKIGSDKLYYDGVRRTTGGTVADAWCIDFMVGLGLVEISTTEVNGVFPLLLTENGKRVYNSMPDMVMPFDETPNVQTVIDQLGADYETVKAVFEDVFKQSLPYKNLSIFLKDKNYWFKSNDFYWDYYNELLDDYEINSSRSFDTAKNRVPSIGQCCLFVGFALSGNIDGNKGIFFFKDKFDFVKNDNLPETKIDKQILDKQTVEDIKQIQKYEHNRLVSGAPGTGKSFYLNKQSKPFGLNMERVTFYPRYSYGQFIGMYKPIETKREDKETIAYRFIPGPFMRTYVRALKKYIEFKNSGGKGLCECFLLLIEEINRAKAAAVFGDVFQLLDRERGESIYPIATSEDIRNYIAKEVFQKENYNSCTDEEKLECETMKIPPNMYIWATMNSADQGVEVLDTAFKRRWEHEYVGIDDAEDDVKDYKVPVGKGSNQRIVNWNELRKGINKILSEKCLVQEDKLLGPFFMTKEVLEKANLSDDERKQFIERFKSKIIMYLFSDAAMGKSAMFSGCENARIYSNICKSFDELGEEVFGFRLE